MPELSQSQQAASDTANAVDKAVHNKVVKALRTNYTALQAAANGDIAPIDSFFKADNRFDYAKLNKYVDDTADALINGTSKRANNLRALIREKNPDDYDNLQNAGKIRKAAADAVYENTGNYEMLKGSTVGNALGGLASWLFSGGNFLQKIGELIGWIFSGLDKDKAPTGLFETIKERGVSNTVTSFENNLAEQGIDPKQGAGAEAVKDFTSKARQKVELDPTPPETNPHHTPIGGFDMPRELAKRNKQAEMTKAASTLNAGDTEGMKAAIGNSFAVMAQNVTDKVNALRPNIPADQLPVVDSLLPLAQETLARKGSELTLKAIADKKTMPTDFEIMRESFKDIDTQLAAKNDPQNQNVRKILGGIIQEMGKENATLTSVRQTLEKSPETANTGLLLGQIATAMDSSKPLRRELFQKATPSNLTAAEIQSQAQEARQMASQEAAANLASNRSTVQDRMDKELSASLTPEKIRATLDKGIAEKAGSWNHNGAMQGTSFIWANLSNVKRIFGGTKDQTIPNDPERDQMANFVSTHLKDIVATEMKKQITSGNPLDVDAVMKTSMGEFNQRYDAAVKRGGELENSWSRVMDSVWVEHKETVTAPIEKEMRQSLQAQKPGFDALLTSSPAKTESSTVASNGKTTGEPFKDLPNPLPTGTGAKSQAKQQAL
jgi:hypothetical protein